MLQVVPWRSMSSELRLTNSEVSDLQKLVDLSYLCIRLLNKRELSNVRTESRDPFEHVMFVRIVLDDQGI